MNEDSISSNADSISSKLAQLKDAINGGDRSLVASLLAAGDIDLEGSIGDTLLHDAVRAGRKEIAEMLLDAGVPIDDAYDKYYYCPVPVCALATPYPDLLQMLIARGANIALGVPRKTTAIATAIWDRHEASLVILLKAGAPIDTSEVCWAAAISVRVIQALLDRGFDLKSLRNNAMGESVGFAASGTMPPRSMFVSCFSMS
jgi:ankyrin repeat protein